MPSPSRRTCLLLVALCGVFTCAAPATAQATPVQRTLVVAQPTVGVVTGNTCELGCDVATTVHLTIDPRAGYTPRWHVCDSANQCTNTVDAAIDVTLHDDMTVSASWVDTASPDVSIVAPPSADYGDDIVIGASAFDTGDGVVVQVDFFLDGAPVGAAIVAPYIVVINGGALSPGPHDLAAVAIDNAGNRSARVGATLFVLAPQAASLSLSSDTSGRAGIASFAPKATLAARFALVGMTTRVTRLSVRAPRGAIVSVTCSARECPFASLGVMSHGRVADFSRPFRTARLRPGARVEISVSTVEGSRVTRYAVRAHRQPLRSSYCLKLGSTKPIAC